MSLCKAAGLTANGKTDRLGGSANKPSAVRPIEKTRCLLTTLFSVHRAYGCYFYRLYRSVCCFGRFNMAGAHLPLNCSSSDCFLFARHKKNKKKTVYWHYKIPYVCADSGKCTESLTFNKATFGATETGQRQDTTRTAHVHISAMHQVPPFPSPHFLPPLRRIADLALSLFIGRWYFCISSSNNEKNTKKVATFHATFSCPYKVHMFPANIA